MTDIELLVVPVFGFHGAAPPLHVRAGPSGRKQTAANKRQLQANSSK